MINQSGKPMTDTSEDVAMDVTENVTIDEITITDATIDYALIATGLAAGVVGLIYFILI